MSISLAMIVRDEERSLARALHSAAPLVDEMVVVDTGSRDASVRIAEAAGARVEHFAWIDDFAAARNYATSLTSGNHVFVLDADEWMQPVDVDVLRRWGASADDGVAGQVWVASSTESNGATVTSRVHSPRLLPRGCRYVGRVHEQPRGYASLSSVDGLVVAHDGYEPAQQSRKTGRNEALLRTMLRDAPHDAYLTFQLGRERQIAGDYGGAATLYATALPAAPAVAPWRDELQARILYSLHHSGRTDESLTLASRFVREAPSAEVLFAAGNLYLDVALERSAHATTFMALAQAAWKACLEVGEPQDGRDSTPGCGSFLAAANLAGWCEAQGDEAGRQHWSKEADRMRAEVMGRS